jgi:hypothetical protein
MKSSVKKALMKLRSRHVNVKGDRVCRIGVTKRDTVHTHNEPVRCIDYRCDNRRFWFSAHNCQVPTPTSQNLDIEQQIRIFGAD